MNRIAGKNRPMANMLRIRRRSRIVRSALGPGRLILTDDGLMGRVRRLQESPGDTSSTRIELDILDGGIALVSSRDVRLVYHD